MARELKQSTVTVVKIGPFVTSTGTVITDLTIPQASVRLSKAGGNMAQKSTATACVHDEIGVYFCDLSAADTDTLGGLRLDVDKSGSASLAVWEWYNVVTAHYWNAKYGTGRIEADVQEIDGASAAAVNFQNMYDGTGYAGGTTRLGVDVQEIDGGSAAAATFLTMYDGTGYAGGAIRLGADIQEIDGASAGAVNMQNFYDGTGYLGGTIKMITTPANASMTAGVFAPRAISSGVFAANALTAGIFAGSCFAIANYDATYRVYFATGIQKNATFPDMEFLLVASSDHRTGKTGLGGATGITMTRSIDGAAWAAGSATLAEIGNGIYVADLAATDTNGDSITLRFTADDADDLFIFMKTSS